MSPRSPSLAEVVRQAIESRLLSLHVQLPGEIVSYDATTQTASIKLSIKNVIPYPDGTGEDVLEYPVLQKVPVAHPRAGDWLVHLPLSPGDHVNVHFAERSIDQWRSLGGVQDPQDLRKHDLSDAVAYPVNLYPDSAALAGVTTNSLMIGKVNGSTIHINADGSIGLGSQTPINAVATAEKVAADATIISAAFAAIGAVPVAADLATAVAAINAVLLAAKAVAIAGYPHSYASTKVKTDP